MRLFKYICILAGLLLATGCSHESFVVPEGPVDDGETLTFGVSVNIGEMRVAPTRAFGDTPDYQNLQLYVAEFDDKGGPLQGNVLTNVYEALNERVNADGDIHFDLKVYKSDQPKILHLIALPKGTDLQLNYGLEGQVIPALTVENETAAYWARVELSNGYGSEKEVGGSLQWVTAADVQGALTHVPMLRNFAKVSMSSSASGFQFGGFVVLNRANKGTVAPWDSGDQSFPVFNKGLNGLSYDEIDYSGYCPVGSEGIVGKETPAESDFTVASKYLYERPASSIDNTVVIFCGVRDGKMRYYKLDIGKSGDDHIFRYYNILRNFDYHINITGVSGNGYDTVEGAMQGVVQNNFSFDVNTAQMLNISNGKQMLWVNQTTFVVNNPAKTEISFRYRFMPDVSKVDTYNNSQLRFYTEVGNSTEEGIKTGSVITSVSAPTGPDAEGYSTVKITTTTPTDENQQASFIVIDPESGLARTINIIVRQPWKYSDSFEWAGTYNTREQFYSTTYPRDDAWQNAVGTAQGDAFTVFFIIEKNIPQAMFPLQFVAEAQEQNIENNKIGTLVVRADDSFFTSGKKAIQYVKTVTWADYNSALTLSNPTGTIVTNADGTSEHRIRMRFLTISTLTAGSTTNIRVYNPYFKSTAGDDYCDFAITAKTFPAGSRPWLWGMDSNAAPTNPTGN